MLRNYKWLELVENLENVLKNTEGVTVSEGKDFSLNNLPYTIYKLETHFGDSKVFKDFNFAYNNLRVYNSKNGDKRYKLHLSRNFFLNPYSECFVGDLIVCYDAKNQKITFGRDYGFKKSEKENKPLTYEQVEQEFNRTLELIQKLNYVKTLCNNNKENEQLVTVYLKDNDLNINELDYSQLKDIVCDGSPKYTELDTTDLFYDILREHFNCDTKEKQDILSYEIGWNEREYFIYRCIDKGLVKDVFRHEDKFYTMRKAS